MSLDKRRNQYFRLAIAILTVLTWTLAVCLADESHGEEPDSEKPDGNSKCYVCHAGLKTEEITTTHVEMNVTCDECHGPCVEHMHDEMLMTKPDLLFGRSEVNRMCSNRMCHAPGDERQVYGRQDHKDHAAVEAFYEKWQGKTRPNGRAIAHDSVCTDCHGTHNLDKATDQLSEQDEQWVAAFNGQDLAGWSSSSGSGGASWSVKGGRIVASAGRNGEAGDLWTEVLYEDYLLAVTFRADWPIHAGIWLRAADTKRERGPRIEIFESKKPFAFTGSVSVPGKGLVLVSLRENLIDRESWNTLSVKVQGNKIQVWLNGEEVGAVRLPGPTRGKIGLHIEGRSVSKPSELHVREVLLQRLSKTEESTCESTSSRSSDKPKQASAAAIRARVVGRASYRLRLRSL